MSTGTEIITSVFSAHAQYKFGQKQPRTTGASAGGRIYWDTVEVFQRKNFNKKTTSSCRDTI